jgi:peptidoglycan/LPS O-acetylase OafA/YrhL
MGTIRLLLALAVLLIMHSTAIRVFGYDIKMIGGAGAVQGFYVISGFYMALVLNEKYGHGAKGYGEFITQRFLRLMPAYWVCVIASVIIGWTGLGTVLPHVGDISPFAFWQQHVHELKPYQIAWMVFNQAFLLTQDWILFFGVNPAHGLYFISNYHDAMNPAYQFAFVAPAWSLGVELAFYLVAPFIVRQRWWIIAIVAACSVGVRLSVRLIWKIPIGADPWVYRFFPSELCTFLLGSLGYHFYAYARQIKWDIRPMGRIALAIILIAIFVVPRAPIPARPFFFFSLMALCVPSIFALTKNWKVDRWIGELSYPVYIVHAVVGAVLAKALHAQNDTDVKGWQLLLATIPLAIAIRLLVEDPVDRWRARMHEKKLRSEAPMEAAAF